MSSVQPPMNRREFLRLSFAFSALAASGRSGQAFMLPPDRGARHYLMIGDWGKDGEHKGQSSVAAAMVRYVQTHNLNTEALLMLGDTWYGPLPGGADDPRWKTQFEEMYPASVFDCPAYSVMGNHDYQRMPLNVSKREAELAYARRRHSRWTQPALWYTYNLPYMKVIALDSNVPMGHIPDGVDFTLTHEEQAAQLAWFKAELATPNPLPFLVVIAHHPVFSDGPHGDHKVLIAEWEPLLREHSVHLYLAGHDHDLQHLEFEGHPTSFVSSGAGGADLYDLKITGDKRGPYAKKIYGFTHLEATPEKLTLRHIDANGTIIHAFTKSKEGLVLEIV